MINMIKLELAPGIVQYIFDPLPDRHFTNSILALIDNNDVLLIDSAFQNQAALLLDDLNKNQMSIKKIVISHFHDDHMQGLKILPKSEVYGSYQFKESLNLWTPIQEHHFFTPDILVDSRYVMNFGCHQITLIPFPGHSSCTLLTQIDGNYIHIADELMFSPDGTPIIPTTDPGCFSRHVESLERLKEFSSYILIPSHGPILICKERTEREINNRIAYFKAILSNDKMISYEDAIKNCDCEFLHSEWHVTNYE